MLLCNQLLTLTHANIVITEAAHERETATQFPACSIATQYSTAAITASPLTRHVKTGGVSASRLLDHPAAASLRMQSPYNCCCLPHRPAADVGTDDDDDDWLRCGKLQIAPSCSRLRPDPRVHYLRPFY